MDSDVLLRLVHVGRSFRMGEVEVKVLHDVNLKIPRGKLGVIVGPSGSGKTTLLNLIGGLDRPSQGTIWFGDSELSALSPRDLWLYRRHSVGFVFQFFNLIPTLTALENVCVGTEIVEKPLDPIKCLNQVGLANRLHHFPSQLSGGEQQRVAIARAVAKNPELLLCDEPTGALDFETGKAVLQLLHNVHRDLGKTVLIITHNHAISRMADYVVRLRSGEVVDVSLSEQPIDPEEVNW